MNIQPIPPGAWRELGSREPVSGSSREQISPIPFDPESVLRPMTEGLDRIHGFETGPLVTREEVLNDYRNAPPLPYIRSDAPKCIICDQPIKPGWLKNGDDPQLCDKKSCWEKFLPMDMAKKYFPPKDRYQILLEQKSSKG